MSAFGDILGRRSTRTETQSHSLHQLLLQTPDSAPRKEREDQAGLTAFCSRRECSETGTESVQMPLPVGMDEKWNFFLFCAYLSCWGWGAE